MRPRKAFLSALMRVMAWSALAAVATLVLERVLSSTSVLLLFAKWWWGVGPYRDLLMPRELPDGIRTAGPVPAGFDATLATGFIATLTLLLTLVHGMIFAWAVAVCLWRAWPPLPAEARVRIDHMAAWSASAARTWWIFPLGVAVIAAWANGYVAQIYSFHVSIAVHWPWRIAFALLLVALAAKRMAGAVRAAVHAAVPPEARGCMGCGYSLFGLAGPVCPECGRTIERGDSWRVTFAGRHAAFRRRVARIAWLGALLLIPTAPAWQPAVVSALPASAIGHLPRILKPLTNAWDAWIPLGADTFLCLRFGNELVVLRTPAKDRKSTNSSVTAWYWDKAPYTADPVAYKNRIDPDDRSNVWRVLPTLAVGAFRLPLGIESITMIGLSPRPGQSWSREVITRNDAPERFRELEACCR